MKSEKEDLSEIGAIIWEAKNLSCRLRDCRFSFIPRSGNGVAHAMSKVHFSEVTELVWVEEVPPEVTSLVDADLSSIFGYLLFSPKLGLLPISYLGVSRMIPWVLPDWIDLLFGFLI
ncbi:hypothetical protein GQ457_11G027020 [Hibiscus cannabinus]